MDKFKKITNRIFVGALIGVALSVGVSFLGAVPAFLSLFGVGGGLMASTLALFGISAGFGIAAISGVARVAAGVITLFNKNNRLTRSQNKEKRREKAKEKAKEKVNELEEKLAQAQENGNGIINILKIKRIERRLNRKAKKAGYESYEAMKEERQLAEEAAEEERAKAEAERAKAAEERARAAEGIGNLAVSSDTKKYYEDLNNKLDYKLFFLGFTKEQAQQIKRAYKTEIDTLRAKAKDTGLTEAEEKRYAEVSLLSKKLASYIRYGSHTDGVGYSGEEEVVNKSEELIGKAQAKLNK